MAERIDRLLEEAKAFVLRIEELLA